MTHTSQQASQSLVQKTRGTRGSSFFHSRPSEKQQKKIPKLSIVVKMFEAPWLQRLTSLIDVLNNLLLMLLAHTTSVYNIIYTL